MLLLLLLANTESVAAERILGSETEEVVDVWPELTWLPESTESLSVEQALSRRDAFEVPNTPRANLGPQRQPFWLRLPLRAEGRAGQQWILAVEYPSLDRIDVYVTSSNAIEDHIRLGRELPFSAHQVRSASPAAQLILTPGKHYDILLRIETRSSAIVPVKLYQPTAFFVHETRIQVIQGILAGLGFCLLVYSLAQWVGVRDPVFGYYALTIVSTTLFFLAYFGLAAQHLWSEQQWLTVYAPPLSVMLALFGSSLFIDTVLDVRSLQPRVSLALRSLALAALTAGAMTLFGLFCYRAIQTLATFLGPLPMLLAIPTAYLRARNGERIGIYILVGWGVYALAAITMATLLRGVLPFNDSTHHAFQIGATFEMVIWIRILGLHTEEIRKTAERIHRERDVLRSLAHTDPLTGLPNRRGLSEALQSVLPSATAQSLTAIYLLDLDGFKPINDTLGHEAGDEVLIQVAHRLKTLVASTDVVARLGGDEFVVVATRFTSEAAASAQATKLLEGFKETFVSGGQRCQVGLTIGYALAPLDGSSSSELLKRADAAMYAGKQAGRGNVTRGAATAYLGPCQSLMNAMVSK